jgi:DNA-binding response OmpR family regulator
MLSSHGPCILCVEDDEDTCDLLRTIFELAHLPVVTAHTVAEGVSWAQRRHFDLYLIDSRLPDGTGLQLCRQLRSLEPATPIVFLSGEAFPADPQEGISAGAQAYLTKPVDPKLLEHTVLQLLRGRPQGNSGGRDREQAIA